MEIVKWDTSWRRLWTDIPGFSEVCQGRHWLCLLSRTWRYSLDACVWRRGNDSTGERNFLYSEYQCWLVKWMSPELHIACVVLCSHQRTLRVSGKMNFILPLLTTLLSSESSLIGPFLPRWWQVQGLVELALLFSKLKGIKRKESRGESGSSCSADAACFRALVPTDTKTNIREMNQMLLLHACSRANVEFNTII